VLVHLHALQHHGLLSYGWNGSKGGDGPWVWQLSEELRDALADAPARRLPAVAEQWVRTEEFWDQATAAEVLPFLGEVTALAGRARQAGERLFCWVCL